MHHKDGGGGGGGKGRNWRDEALGKYYMGIVPEACGDWQGHADNTENEWHALTLSLPIVINVKFLLQPHQKYYTTQYEEHCFS